MVWWGGIGGGGEEGCGGGEVGEVEIGREGGHFVCRCRGRTDGRRVVEVGRFFVIFGGRARVISVGGPLVRRASGVVVCFSASCGSNW